MKFDQDGNTYFYFVVPTFGSILLLITLAYCCWPKDDGYEQRNMEALQKKRRNQKLTKLVLFVAWIIFAVLASKASTLESHFDPYEVLGVSRGATSATIRKEYRRLIRKIRSDKGGDEDVSIRVQRAYDILMDEETRENWDYYGNPDGPQALEFGIALPSWLLDRKNYIPAAGLYVALFCALPIIIACFLC